MVAPHLRVGGILLSSPVASIPDELHHSHTVYNVLVVSRLLPVRFSRFGQPQSPPDNHTDSIAASAGAATASPYQVIWSISADKKQAAQALDEPSGAAHRPCVFFFTVLVQKCLHSFFMWV